MKQILLSMIRSWLIEKAYDKIITPLRHKVHQTDNKWDDEMVNEIEQLIANWLK